MDELSELTSELNVRPLSTSDLRVLPSLPLEKSYIADGGQSRSQIYEIQLERCSKVLFAILENMANREDRSRMACVRMSDESGEVFALHLSPEIIFDSTGYWLDLDLIEWSIKKEIDEISQIIHYAVSEIAEFFAWSYHDLISLENILSDLPKNQSAILLGRTNQHLMIVDGGPQLIREMEQTLRNYSIPYHQNCVWLGARIRFEIKCSIKPIKSEFTLQEIFDLELGDLLLLPQKPISDNEVLLNARALCEGLQGRAWGIDCYLKINSEGIAMEFDDDEWERTDLTGSEGSRPIEGSTTVFTTGEQGPDAVTVDVMVGSTQISFNDLCNLGEGSLLEIPRNMFPMVEINVANEKIFEGELVRLNDQIMVQITRKID